MGQGVGEEGVIGKNIKWLLGKVLYGYGFLVMCFSPVNGFVTLHVESQRAGQSLWQPLPLALFATSFSLLVGYSLWRIGRKMLRDALPSTIKSSTILSWLVLLAGTGLMLVGVTTWNQGDYTTAGTAISGGFTIAAIGFGMLKES